MATRRPVLYGLALAVAALWLLQAAVTPAMQQELFVVQTPAATTPALRATQGSAGTFAGAQQEVTLRSMVVQALPEPRPNDAMLPVDLNRTSLYWGLLCILILSVLFSSYFFN
eukprot:CAMPEP_0179187060 /NCGR_PEP_ID=MMETSP0796-20121207/92805_1 /TAXON_ID=73915 /ORGANISM="Pyrodinium bahamense, Strain pbaha01" /LENGTH=112 /DNA_ID=CAMNT_0020891099 /DNA_START=71 /DNA_END=409 /DNA_ORIENTATION=+